MRRVALIYNPVSGRPHAQRAMLIAAALAELRRAGVEADAVETRAAGTAGEQAREAVARGCDAVLACGGDGTVNEVLQGMIGTEAALGVVPLGTANALAIDLGLPSQSARAARVLLTYEPVRIAVGQVSFCRGGSKPTSRYFTVAAGIGPDAHLMYHLNVQLKRRYGYPVYIAEALRVWATHSYPLFDVELCNGSGIRRERVSQVLAVRIGDFGGMLRRLAPGAELSHDHLRLVLFKTRSRLRYLRYMTAILFGREPRVPDIELLDATTVECRLPAGAANRTYVEADGELLGTLPAKVEIVPGAVNLLMPPASSRKRLVDDLAAKLKRSPEC
jgi:YegS/Rv2252/BmrU family lipid kinase